MIRRLCKALMSSKQGLDMLYGCNQIIWDEAYRRQTKAHKKLT